MADSTESSTPTTQRQQPAWRSQASMNWRAKDDSPRVERQSPAPSTRGGQSRFSNRSDGAQPQAGSDASGNASRLYVGNLLYTAQKADIETLFTDKGFNVVNVSISTDPFTGRNPSYCFVDLDSPDEAQRAIAELNGVDVMGRSLRVSPGVAKRNSAAQGGPGRGQEDSPDGGREVRVKNFERGWGRESREERNTEYKPTFDRWNRTDASSHWQAPQTEGRRLYFGNLPRIEPQSALDEEIQLLFATYVTPGDVSETALKPTAVSKLISPHPSKIVEGAAGNHHYCFVDLERAEDVDLVISKLDGVEGSWGGNLRVNRAREQRERPASDRGGERKVVREQGLRSSGGGGGGGVWRRAAPREEES